MKTAALAAALCACAATACADQGSDPVIGPFTGETHRYVVDSVTVPLNSAEAHTLSDDLDGDDRPDNAIGALTAMLAMFDDVTPHAADMIAAGTIASTVEIVADDLTTDDTVSVLYIGADGAPASVVGGTFADGVFFSNRTRTTDVPGTAELHLPVYQDADPGILPLVGVEIDLVPDGAGGFDGVIRGGVPPSAALAAAADGMAQMVASDPGGHRGMIDDFDTPPKDNVVTSAEVASNTLIAALCGSDVAVPSGSGEQLAVSAAIGVHLRPCDAGNCNLTASFDRCFDRILDGGETDVDCGGSCRACEAGATCITATDCETGVCTGGTCGPASCSDGRRDGIEEGVDCGAACETFCP